jgi:hypothetical protein
MDQVLNYPLGMIYLCQAEIIEIDYFRQVVGKPVLMVGRLEVVSENLSGFSQK